MHNGDMAEDWVDDENLTREEKLARFEELGPQPTRGPRAREGANHSPKIPGGYLVHRANSSFGSVVVSAPKIGTHFSPRLESNRSTAPSSTPAA